MLSPISILFPNRFEDLIFIACNLALKCYGTGLFCEFMPGIFYKPYIWACPKIIHLGNQNAETISANTLRMKQVMRIL